MKSLLVTLLLAHLGSAWAQPEIPVDVIQPLVRSYLNAVGCAGGVTPEHIARFVDPEKNIRGYIAVGDSDVICAGGSGTWWPVIVFVRTAEGREGSEHHDDSYLKVDPLLSEPVAQTRNASRGVGRVYEEHGEVYAVGLDYAETDGNCCPSVKSLTKIKLLKETIGSGYLQRANYTWVYSPVQK